MVLEKVDDIRMATVRNTFYGNYIYAELSLSEGISRVNMGKPGGRISPLSERGSTTFFEFLIHGVNLWGSHRPPSSAF